MTEDIGATVTERRITQRGLWFDELEQDVVYEHRPGRTMTETDNVLFTTLTMNPQPLHLDRAFSETTDAPVARSRTERNHWADA